MFHRFSLDNFQLSKCLSYDMLLACLYTDTSSFTSLSKHSSKFDIYTIALFSLKA